MSLYKECRTGARLLSFAIALGPHEVHLLYMIIAQPVYRDSAKAKLKNRAPV